ncbi:deoxyguanosinetriphosphate triphosphohydrolase [Clostridiaceae bacterium M8S5]|nr:deoxyguanosinetriphosphate triphosphohydrolase [Clostridiaceae bacterium M8S5]
MKIRENTEMLELKILSKFAKKSCDSKGREIEEEKCDIRTDYQRDRDRILHSKAFRRLKHKTQVFLIPEGDHFRTRLTHTLEVSQIARTIARAIRINEDLTEAIALGHDLGHTPFGHAGEMVLNNLHKAGFKHNEHSLRIVDYIEIRNKNRGLNLTYEVRDGILNHTGNKKPCTLEGQLVRICDRIAYINHDIDDAIRAGILKTDMLPKKCLDYVGNTHGERINNMIIDIINNSTDQNEIIMSESMSYYMNELREFMFKNVYLDKNAKQEESKAKYVIRQLYDYYIINTESLPTELKTIDENTKNVACYYIAGMTDRYAINKFNELFVPKPWDKF